MYSRNISEKYSKAINVNLNQGAVVERLSMTFTADGRAKITSDFELFSSNP